MLSNFHKNTMGTASFDGKFDGMRKAQEFITYPLKADDDVSKLMIQSDTRIGLVYLGDGRLYMSPSFPGGAYGHHLSLGKFLTPLTAEELLLLKSNVMATASGKAGDNGIIYCDNSKALDVFASTESGSAQVN